MASQAVVRSGMSTEAGLTAARAVLEKAVAERAFPGAAYGVLHRGSIAALDAVGRFRYEADAPAVEPETVFDLASVSKVMATTAAAMLLADRGKLDLDARLGDLLPGFVIGMTPGSGKERVTLRMLLAHTSGLTAYATLFREHRTPDMLLRAVLRLGLEAKPGTRTEYSDFGFLLLGKAIEILAGEGLDVFCAREIFAPLGLATTGFRPARERRPSIPPTEDDRTFRGRVIQGEVQDENCWVLGGVAGHAGLFAPVRDVDRIAQELLACYAGRSEWLPQRVVREFWTRDTTVNGSTWALGWDMPSTQYSSSGKHFSPAAVGHLGFTGTSIWIEPERAISISLLTNRVHPRRDNQAIRDFRPRIHDLIMEAIDANK